MRLSENEGGPVTGFRANVKINCSECGQPFEFMGLQPGFSKTEPKVNHDATQAQLPLRPHVEQPRKPLTYVKHLVADMNESGVQYCLLCGAEVYNINGVYYPKDSPPPKGYPQGEVYISQNINPTISITSYPANDNVINCKDL